MRWFNEPPRWHGDADRLEVRTAPDTDLWQRTHYGFVRDTGHAWLQTVTGDVEVHVAVSGAYRDRYDQAGLLVRVAPTLWLKTGIEFVDGQQLASTVVTREWSDWSAAPLEPAPETYWVRLTREGGAITVHGSTDGDHWRFQRLAWLTDEPTIEVGPMCASPDGGGFDVVFRDLVVRS
jgi:uncharacterized protein